jgi:hypothetical protein
LENLDATVAYRITRYKLDESSPFGICGAISRRAKENHSRNRQKRFVLAPSGRRVCLSQENQHALDQNDPCTHHWQDYCLSICTRDLARTAGKVCPCLLKRRYLIVGDRGPLASRTPEMVGRRLLLKVVMAAFAKFLGVEVESPYFWLYGHAIKPDETVSDVCYIYSSFIPVLLITAYIAWHGRG